jgi:hypothetical protein
MIPTRPPPINLSWGEAAVLYSPFGEARLDRTPSREPLGSSDCLNPVGGAMSPVNPLLSFLHPFNKIHYFLIAFD